MCTAGLAAVLCAGCASTSSTTQQAASRVRFSAFHAAQLKLVAYPGGDRTSSYDETFIRALNEALYYELGLWVTPVEIVPAGGEFHPVSRRTLLIEPRVLNMHAVSPTERFWYTWGAGDSSITLQLVFRDSATGEVIAEPVFFRDAPAFVASWTEGQIEYDLPRQVAGDVDYYVMTNR
jgi:hypothetical protein